MGCNFSKEEAPPLSEDGTESQNLPDKGQPVSQRSKSFANLEDLMGSDEIMEYLPTTGPLTAKEYKSRQTAVETQSLSFPMTGVTLRYASVTQRGFYPDAPDKANQDASCMISRFGGESEQAFFAVFDGHGEYGTQCAQFARDKVPDLLLSNPQFLVSPEVAYLRAMVQTNALLHSQPDIDDSMSGTTAITTLLRGRTLYVANVGDSRCVLAERSGDKLLAQDLSYDQTPFRRDECERVKRCGAHVLTLDQVEGLKDPNIEIWGTEEENDGDPPRLWAPNATYPGTAFTRSIGDATAERIGVCAEPEVVVKQLNSSHPFMVIASDGVWEFLSSQSVVDMVSKFDDPQEACLSVVAESYRLWLQHETRTDDITMIVVHFQGLKEEAPKMALPTPLGASLDFTTRPMHMNMSRRAYSLASRFTLQLTPIEPVLTHADMPVSLARPSPSHPGIAAAVLGSGNLSRMSSRRNMATPTAQAISLLGGGAAASSRGGGDGGGGGGGELPILPPLLGAAGYSTGGPDRGTAGLYGNLLYTRQYSGDTAAADGFRKQFSGLTSGDASLASRMSGGTEGGGGAGASRQTQARVAAAVVAAAVGGSDSPSSLLGPLGHPGASAAGSHTTTSPSTGNNSGTLPLMGGAPFHRATRTSSTGHLAGVFGGAAGATAAAAASAAGLSREPLSAAQARFLDRAVRPHFLFSRLTATQREAALALFERRVVAAGEVLVQQGESADELYVVETGEYEVWVQSGAPRRSSLRSSNSGAHGAPPTSAQLSTVPSLARPLPNPLLAQGRSHSMGGGAPGGAGAGAGAGVALVQMLPQGQAAAAAAAALLGNAHHVHTYATLPSSLDDPLQAAGGPAPDAAPSGSGGAPGGFGAGVACFGEVALLYPKPRAATVVARTDGVVWTLARTAFRSLLQHLETDQDAPLPPPLPLPLAPGPDTSLRDATAAGATVSAPLPPAVAGVAAADLRGVVQALRSLEVLQCLGMSQLHRLAAVMEQVVYQDGQYVIRQGEEGREFYLLQSGGVLCTVRKNPDDPNEAAREVLRLIAGQYFGERALLTSAPRAANVIAQGPVTVYRLCRGQLERVLGGPLQAVKELEAAWRSSLVGQREVLARKSTAVGKLVQGNCSLDDLRACGLLFATDCAALMLMDHKNGDGNDVFTVRVTSVADVVALGKQPAVLRARDITRSLEPSFFVPGVQYCFKDTRVVAEVLMTEGFCTLESLLMRSPLDEASAAFLSACVVLGLEHLHWSGVLYRGLSEHTTIVTEAGQVQLVDFRFARRYDGRTYTLCGYPEYLAPELLLGRAHNEAVDMWALGVLVYFMLAGETPFAAAGDELRMYQAIAQHGRGGAAMQFPPHFSPVACNLIASLLHPDPDQRLGVGPLGIAALKAHPWFEEQRVDWDALMDHSCSPPLGVRERIYNYEGLSAVHFDPKPCEADTMWINVF